MSQKWHTALMWCSILTTVLLVATGRCALTAESISANQNDNDVYVLEAAVDDSFRELATLNLRTLRQSQNAAHLHSLNSASEHAAMGGSRAANSDGGSEQHTPAMLRHQAVSVFASFSTPVESQQLEAALRDMMTECADVVAQSSVSAGCSALIRLRLCRHTAAASKCYASTFTYVRNVVESRGAINLTIFTGSNQNVVNSISVKTVPVAPVPSSAQSAESSKTSKSKKTLSTSSNEWDHIVINVVIQNIKAATLPDTETYLEKIKKEIEQKKEGAQADNQSFLSKYWIYIVPFVIIMFLMNIVNPEAAAAR